MCPASAASWFGFLSVSKWLVMVKAHWPTRKTIDLGLSILSSDWQLERCNVDIGG
jgi:hypothetical protein